MNSFLIPVNFSPKNQEHVQLLQQALIVLNYATVSSFTDRSYGSAAKTAVQTFRADNALASSTNMNAETINLLNAQLEELYRVCGHLKDDYDMPIEGAEVIVYETNYEGTKTERGKGISLEDGSFRVYLTFPNTSFNKSGLLKGKINLLIEIKQDGIVKFTEGNLLIQDKENVFNFSSASFTYKGESTYTTLINTLLSHGLATSRLNDVVKTNLLSKKISELVAISSATGIEPETLMRMFFAEILESKATQTFNGKDCIFSGIGAEVFFGFLYQGIPSNVPKRLYNETAIGLTDDDVVGFTRYKNQIAEQMNIGLGLMSQETLHNALRTACKAYIIDAHDETWITNNVQLILNKKGDIATTSPLLEGNVKLSDIIGAAATSLTAAQKTEIANLFVDHIHEFNAFIEALDEASNRTKYGSANIDKLILTFQISRVTRNYVTLINAVKTKHQTSFNSYGIRFLGTISMEEWVELSNKTYPADFENFEKYARFVYENAQILYPEIATVTKLKNAAGEKFTYASIIETVLLQNKALDILKNNFEEFNISDTYKNNPAFVKEFKTVQRVHRISPSPEVAAVLLENGISSATQVYSIGKQQLTANFEGILSASEINNVFSLATGRISNALIAYTNMNAAFSTTTPYVIPGMVMGNDGNEDGGRGGLKDIPNIEKLFGEIDSCECTHDTSVYSPAAYLADLLEFLDNCDDTGIQEFLNERRPDISNIALNEQNTNTMLPYIDLVCEILEEQVIRFKETVFVRDPKAYNSGLTTKELCAAPEHILKSNTHGTAYDIIKSSVYPMYASLNLNQMESRSYLGLIGIARHDLMQAFQKVYTEQDVVKRLPENSSIAAEYFGLSTLEQDIVTAKTALNTRNEAWRQNAFQPSVGTKKKMMIEDFMRDTCLSEYEVMDITHAGWVQLTDLNLENCSMKKATITGEPSGFDRAHRFIRLCKKSGWKIWELNLLLKSKVSNFTTTATDNLNENTLHQLKVFSQQQQKLRLSCESLLAFYGNINHLETYENGKQQHSLYKRLFLNNTLTDHPNQKLVDIEKDPTKTITNAENELVAACLSISQADYELLESLYDYDDDRGMDIQPKNLAFLSFIYRNVLLSKSLGISIPELAALIKIRFPKTRRFHLSYSLEEVDEIIEICKSINKSGINIIEYDYLTRYGFNVTNRNKISDEAKKLAINPIQLKELIEKMKKVVGHFTPLPTILEGTIIEAEPNTYTAAPAYKAALSEGLASMEQFQDAKTREEMIRIIEGTTEKSQEEIESWAKNFIPQFFEEASNDHFEALDEETPDEFFVVNNFFTNVTLVTAEQLFERYEFAINFIEQLETANAVAIKTYIAEFFDIPIKIANTILKFTVDENKTILSKFLRKENYSGIAQEINQYLVLIHKIVMLIKKINMTAEDFDRLLKIQTKLGFDFTKMRKDKSIRTEYMDIQPMLNLSRIYALHKSCGMSMEGKSLFDLFYTISESKAGQIPDKSFCTELCKLTQWNIEHTTDLLMAANLNITYQDLYSAATYDRINRCMTILERIGLPVATITHATTGWRIRATTNSNENIQAASIKNAVKALYDLDTWYKELAILQKPIREAKADALASYLIAYSQRTLPEPWNDKIDLYDYFLLDTEMSADMKTSRIVQATNAIQLFVQRCFLNLEDKVTRDENEGWEYWDWKKRYRLWEANRKVFLYPENWIEPELRDDKSPFFKELEDELNQSDITPEHVETVFENYLHKLHEVSNLMVIGIYKEKETDTLHVVGRSKSTPYQYFYRNCHLNTTTWSHWEKIELDIKGDVVIPMVYNRKLHLFWISVTSKTYNSSSNNDSKNPYNYHEIQLGWSILKNKKWSGVKYSKRKLVQFGQPPILDYSLVAQLINNKAEIEFRIYKHWFDNPEKACSSCLQLGLFHFNGDVYRSESNIGDFFNKKIIALENEIKYFEQHNSEAEIESNEEDISKIFSDITGKMDYDEKPEPDSTEAIVFWPNRSTLRSSRLFPMKYEDEKKWSIYLHNCSYYTEKSEWTVKLLDSNNQNPNVVQMLHDYDSMWHSVFCSYAQPMFYQDSKRSFFIWPSWLSDWNCHYKFYPSSHPYTELFIKELNQKGVSGILNREIQLIGTPESPDTHSDFGSEYQLANEEKFVQTSFPKGTIDIIDFEPSTYSQYNWELFFHAPLYIACKLSQNQKYEEAMNWFHYIFDPMDKSSEEVPKKFWITKPFFEVSDAKYREQQILEILKGLDKWQSQVDAWLANPYNPHLVARTRIVAFQKAVIMKYLDNLIAWADYLFKQDTMESNNEAALLYVLAYRILGKRPVMFPKAEPSKVTYKDIKANIQSGNGHFLELYDNAIAYQYNQTMDMSSIANAENITPSQLEQTSHYSMAPKLLNASTSGSESSPGEGYEPLQSASLASIGGIVAQGQTVNSPSPKTRTTGALPLVDADHFCIPQNEKLLEYWDVVEDRLFKLRNCMNIQGIVRELPLFAPPIDPALLVRATAAGLSIDDILNDSSAPQPYYRFRVVLQKAIEFTGEVKQLGEKLLSAFEKRDAEILSLLRSSQEVNMQKAIKQVRKLQIDEAKQNIEALKESIKNAEARKTYYESKELMNNLESKAYKLSEASTIMTDVVSAGYAAAAISAMIPDFTAGGAGVMGSPLVSLTIGGEKITQAINATMAALSQISQSLDKHASLLLTKSGYQRRKEEWDFQAKVSGMEMAQLDKQLIASEIRLMMAEKELENLDMQIEQSQSVKEYYQYKYTNEELYNWMITQISTLYFQAYKLAYDMAKKAEKCYRNELGIYDNPAPYIKFGHWDSLRKGLLSGDCLMHDLHQLDAAYINANKRTLELTKHISLAQIAPDALLELITNKQTTLNLEEYLFDMDYPGHYMRRIKSVSVTIPNVAGPHTTVSFMLTLLNNSKVRVKPASLTGEYDENPEGNDARFIYQNARSASICTSSAQNDSGMFELNFGDERYLPFENFGVISKWKLSFPAGCDQFDLSSVSDVILHIKYTALDGGESVANRAKEALEDKFPESGRMLFSLKHGFSKEWEQLTDDNLNMDFELKMEHLPFFLRGKTENMKTSNSVLILVSKESDLKNKLITLTKGTTSLAFSLEDPVPCSNLYLYQAEVTSKIPVIGVWEASLGTALNKISPAVVEDIIIGLNLTEN